jgi:phosphonopyruvate decarboxylase
MYLYHSANEGDAVACCAGASVGGARPVVLMQNSGLTNAVSPLTSLTNIFRIPVLGFVSLRGEEGVTDEPQHELTGKITTAMLDLMEIPWSYLSKDVDEAFSQLKNADKYISSDKTFFFVVRKGTFSDVPLKTQAIRKASQLFQIQHVSKPEWPSRRQAIEVINALRQKTLC